MLVGLPEIFVGIPPLTLVELEIVGGGFVSEEVTVSQVKSEIPTNQDLGFVLVADCINVSTPQ